MRGRIAVLALLAAAAASAESGKPRSFRFAQGGRDVRVVVPTVFEPLLPGSVYPDRRRPASPREMLLVVVDRALARSAEPFLLDRGCIVAVVDSVDRELLAGLLAEIPRRAGRTIDAVGILSARASDVLSDPRIRAAALFEPPDPNAGGGGDCRPVAVFRRTPSADLPDSRPSKCVREKWYRASGAFPPEAFRDAAEWLAAPPSD
jgi:hypothetical protein